MPAAILLFRTAHNQPSWVCESCGKEHGMRPMSLLGTWERGRCGVCCIEGLVTEPRNFGYLKRTWYGWKHG